MKLYLPAHNLGAILSSEVGPAQINGKVLLVDSFNILIFIESLISEGLLFEEFSK